MLRGLIAIALSALLAGLFFYRGSILALARADYNVSGFAWSDNFGWISHNWKDVNSDVDYGVNIENDGFLKGYAWGDNIGWVQYDPLGPYPSAPAYSARYDICAKKITGWAKIIGWGDDGWILLGKAPNGVDIGGDNKFSGYSWNDIAGWIQYNPNVYTVRDLNAISSPVIASVSLNVPSDLALDVSLQPALSWVFDNGGCAVLGQQSYLIEIKKGADFASGTDLKTINNISSNTSYALSISDSLNYNQTYVWRVTLTLSNGEVIVSGARSFTTLKHAKPLADFDASPLMVDFIAGQEVQFFDRSQFFDAGNHSWLWNFGDLTTSTLQNPKHIFDDSQNVTITLTVTDSDGYEGTVVKTTEVKLPLPEYRRTGPK